MQRKDIIIICVFVSVIIACFLFNNRSKESSVSKKLLSKIKKEYTIIVTIIGGYILFNYIFYLSQFDDFNENSIVWIIATQINNLFNNISELLNRIIDAIINENILKILIIGLFILRILKSENIFEQIKDLLSQIKELSYKDFSVKIKEALINEQDVREKEIEQLKVESNEGKKTQAEINLQIKSVEEEKEIIAILVDNDKLVGYINDFLYGNVSQIVLPINLIPRKISLTAIEKIFTYETGVRSFKLTSIKKEKYAIVKKVFDSLVDKGIIYCK